MAAKENRRRRLRLITWPAARPEGDEKRTRSQRKGEEEVAGKGRCRQLVCPDCILETSPALYQIERR